MEHCWKRRRWMRIAEERKGSRLIIIDRWFDNNLPSFSFHLFSVQSLSFFSFFLLLPPAIIEASRQAGRFLINFLATGRNNRGDDWLMYAAPRGGLPNFPIPDTRLRNEAKNRWFIIVVGPFVSSRLLSHDRSEENRSRGTAQRVEALARPPPNDTSPLETIYFRMYNFVKFCFSISGIGYGSIFVFSSIRPSSSSSRNFPFPRGKKKKYSLASYPWLE